MVVGCGRENGSGTKTADASDVALGLGKGIKKVSQSPVGEQSYGRSRDRLEGRHGDIVQLMRS
jgi:hypothetical protein